MKKLTKKMVEWCVLVFDKKGTDRSACRAAHLAAIPQSVEAGIVTNAGAIFHEIPSPSHEKPPFAGSAFNIVADSKEEVLEFLKKDIYAKEGIWDLENVVMYPYGCAVRKEKVLPK